MEIANQHIGSTKPMETLNFMGLIFSRIFYKNGRIIM